MSLSETLLPEFDHEMGTTRSLLERVPEDQRDWKPHVKSMTLGKLANHLASLPRWVALTLRQTELDVAGAGDFRPPEFTSTAAMLKLFDESVKDARELLAKVPDADLGVQWTLRSGNQNIFTLPRLAVLRSTVLNHMIHHRGQLSVYLRLRDVPLPSIYGPTADMAM